MKKTITTIILLGAFANAGTVFKNYNLGVSTFNTKVENQTAVKCVKVENNLKAWRTCKKRVIKQIVKNSKKG